MFLIDIAYIFILIITLPYWINVFFKPKYRRLLRRRFSPDLLPTKKKRIWIHAVSVGEVRSLKSLIHQLRAQHDREIVLSCTTPSGFQAALSEYPDIAVINSPIDFTFTVRKFLKKINPAILILNELEIWPNWTLLTHKAGVPILLINGRMSERAYARYRLMGPLLKRLFARIDLFLVQADIYKQMFSSLGIPPQKIVVCGNIKAETASRAVAHSPKEQEILDYLKIKKNQKQIFTMASTHAGDEKLLIPLLKKLGGKFSIIIVPRHIDRTEEIEKLLGNQDLKHSRWSEGKLNNIEDEILVFDSMGYLFNILKISDIVCMGGTFDKKIGGHNLYEPAALGKLIVGGPFYHSFPDIGKELEDKGIYRKAGNANELVDWLLKNDKIDFEQIATQARDSVYRREGSIECIAKEVRQLIG